MFILNVNQRQQSNVNAEIHNRKQKYNKPFVTENYLKAEASRIREHFFALNCKEFKLFLHTDSFLFLNKFFSNHVLFSSSFFSQKISFRFVLKQKKNSQHNQNFFQLWK